jgi:hypothetical protein
MDQKSSVLRKLGLNSLEDVLEGYKEFIQWQLNLLILNWFGIFLFSQSILGRIRFIPYHYRKSSSFPHKKLRVT